MYIPPGAPLPPEIQKHEREYRAERIRQGSTADPITGIFHIFVIIGVVAFRMLRWAFRKLLFRKGPAGPVAQEAVVQEDKAIEETQTWKSRS